MIYKLFKEMNYILQECKVENREYFINNFHLCRNILNNLDKSAISSKLKHEDNDLNVK